MEELKKILHEQIKWYKESKQGQEVWELDSSYIYDLAIEQFYDLSKSDAENILKILSE